MEALLVLSIKIKEEMKDKDNSPALEVKEDGQIWLIPECPVEPKYTDYVRHTKYHWQVNKFERARRDYQKSLASAERYLVSNQEVARMLCQSANKTGSFHHCKLEPGIYPIPGLKWHKSDWQTERLLSTGGAHKQMPLRGECAVISLPESKSESPLIGEQKQFTIHELRAAYYAGVNKLGFDEWHKKFQEMYAPLKSSALIGERSPKDVLDAVLDEAGVLLDDDIYRLAHKAIYQYESAALQYCHKRMAEAYNEIRRLKAKEDSLPEATEWTTVSLDNGETVKHYGVRVESKEDNKAFGEQDAIYSLKDMFDFAQFAASAADDGFYAGHLKNVFKNWIATRKPRIER